MGQVLHGCATTTEGVRRAIQARQESVRAAAKRYGVSPTTVQKWRSRQASTDAPMGPKEPRSTVLSAEDEAMVVAFRRHTLLPLDNCLYALQPTIPHLTRSSLHRCLQRHGISRLPDVDGDQPKRSRFKAYPIGYFHVDIAQVSTEHGKLHLFVAVDRTSKFAFVQLHEKATQRVAAAFLHDLAAAVPYTIHTVLTDNGIQFTDTRPVSEAVGAAYPGRAIERPTPIPRDDIYANLRSTDGIGTEGVRIAVRDGVGTTVYINPVTGRVIEVMDTSRRAYRWPQSSPHF